MSAQPHLIPLSRSELTDWRTAKLTLLVVRLVAALASNNSKELVAVIGIFARYFTALLSSLERLEARQKDPSAQGTPFVWIYPALLKKSPLAIMDVQSSRKALVTRHRQQSRITPQIDSLFVQLFAALNTDSKLKADIAAQALLEAVEELPHQWSPQSPHGTIPTLTGV